jgi:hypothetical protein
LKCKGNVSAFSSGSILLLLECGPYVVINPAKCRHATPGKYKRRNTFALTNKTLSYEKAFCSSINI